MFHKIKGNQEFPDDTPGIGDVLSHLGTSVELNYENSSVNVSLIHNPSHLEAVNPVAMGKTRAKQMDAMPFEDIDGSSFEKSLCVQLHGDAAFVVFI